MSFWSRQIPTRYIRSTEHDNCRDRVTLSLESKDGHHRWWRIADELKLSNDLDLNMDHPGTI